MKTPVLESLFNKVAGLDACIFIKKRKQHRYFPVNIAKFSRTAFFIEYPQWLPVIVKHLTVNTFPPNVSFLY